MRIVCLLLLAALPVAAPPQRGGSVHSGSAKKEPWNYSDAERVTARLEHDRRDRVSGQSNAASSVHEYRERIDGRVTPELFLPFELFDRLVGGIASDLQHRTGVRATLRRGIVRYGYNADTFWSSLAAASAPYVKEREKHRNGYSHAPQFTTSSGKTVTAAIDRDVCLARIAALNETRRRFGAAAFDRFLYEVVAPQTRYGGSRKSEEYGEELLFQARGCQ